MNGILIQNIVMTITPCMPMGKMHKILTEYLNLLFMGQSYVANQTYQIN